MIESKIDIANITFTHPSDWSVIKIKYLLSTKVTDGPHETPTFIDEGYPFLSVDSIVDGKLVFEGCRYISKEDYDKYKLKCNPQKDDIFMGKAASIGKIAIVDVDFNFSIWSPLALLRPDQNMILSKYLEFALKSDYAQDQIDLYSTSNTQKNISMDDIPRIELLVPNLEQQKTINNYLIKKTSKIDETIAKNKELIDLLEEKRVALINQVVTKGLNHDVPMKDSGVDIIGNVPSNNDLIRLKFLCDIKTGDKDTVNRNPDGQYPFYVRSPIVERIDTYSFDGEAVLMAGDGVGAGKVFHYATGKFDYHQRVYNLHNFKHVLPKFIYYYMSSLFSIEIEKGSAKSTVDSVRLPMLEDFLISFPSIEEQQEIIDYLDYEITKINETLTKVTENINLLEEYKTSLIHHVVTGKIDVRGEEI